MSHFVELFRIFGKSILSTGYSLCMTNLYIHLYSPLLLQKKEKSWIKFFNNIFQQYSIFWIPTMINHRKGTAYT